MTQRYRVIILPRAADDLVALCGYIEQDSAQNAASVAQRLLASFYSLQVLPHRYKVHVRRKDPAQSVHSMPVPPYIVYYRVDDA